MTMTVTHPVFPGVTRTVPDAEVDAWVKAGWQPASAETTEADDDNTELDSVPIYPEGDPHTTWTLAQLTAWAHERGVDLAGASTKTQILAAIAAATTTNAAAGA